MIEMMKIRVYHDWLSFGPWNKLFQLVFFFFFNWPCTFFAPWMVFSAMILPYTSVETFVFIAMVVSTMQWLFKLSLLSSVLISKSVRVQLFHWIWSVHILWRKQCNTVWHLSFTRNVLLTERFLAVFSLIFIPRLVLFRHLLFLPVLSFHLHCCFLDILRMATMQKVPPPFFF